MKNKQFTQYDALTCILFLFLLVPGCALPPSSSYPPTPAPSPSTGTYEPELGKAASLYHKAETSRSQGHYHQAELELERALRIEPRNAHYWHTMAKIKFHQKRYEQTIQFCLKSKSLAGNSKKILSLNDALIAEAEQKQAN